MKKKDYKNLYRPFLCGLLVVLVLCLALYLIMALIKSDQKKEWEEIERDKDEKTKNISILETETTISYEISVTPELEKEFKVYWNVPSFQCKPHKLNFSNLAEKYGIIQNENDEFRGDDVVILYDPGEFPAVLKNGTKEVLRNGGVPQEGNLTAHLKAFEADVAELIPNTEFSGIGIIDFESWRAIFRQNFGSLTPSQERSISIERKKHPYQANTRLEKASAAESFEFYARQFMEKTLLLAKQLRPKAAWGYYSYPYCFNMSPSNMRKQCPKEAIQENNRLDWLFETSDNLHPSLYFEKYRLTADEKIEMIEGRMDEAHRIVKQIKNVPKILPYFWFKYQDTKGFLSKEDLFNSLLALTESRIDGIVLWGSSNDVNGKSKCLEVYQYVDDVLGPVLATILN